MQKKFPYAFAAAAAVLAAGSAVYAVGGTAPEAAGADRASQPGDAAKTAELLGVRKVAQASFGGSSQVAPAPLTRSLSAPDGTDVPVINASVIFPDNIMGMWSYSTSEYNPEQLAIGINASGGGFAANGYYYITRYLEAMGFEEIKTINYNLSDWSEYDSYVGKINYVATTMAYSPIHDEVYGCFVNEERSGYNLCEWNYSYFQPKRVIRALERPWAGCAFASDGSFYAIERNGDLYKVNRRNGDMTLVGSTGIVTVYQADATIDPATDTMYWCVNTDTDNALYAVDITTAKATKLYDLLNQEQLSGMYIPEPAKEYAPGSPAALSSTPSLSFSGANLTGNVAFYPPRLAFDGSALDTETMLTYYIRANGKLLATGECKPSTRTTVPVTLEEPDSYYFTVTTANEAGESAPKGSHKFVGPDTPKAPTSFTASIKGNTVTLNWNWPSSTGINGGNVDYSSSKFTVVRQPDNKVVCENLEATRTVTDELPDCNVRTDFYYTLLTEVSGLKSGLAVSPVISLGPVTPPFTFEFPSTVSTAGWTIVDVAGDDYLWKPYSSYKCLQLYGSKGFDDWAITPAVNVRAGTSYPVSVDLATSNYYEETVEIFWGTEPTVEAMTNKVMDDIVMKSSTRQVYEGEIQATATGKIYIGIHGATKEKSSTVNLYALTIEDGTTAAAPAAVANLTVTSPVDGSRQATVSFTLPTLTIDGKPLEGDAAITSAAISRDGKVIKTIENPAAGSEVSYIDEADDLTLGTHLYSVVVSNAAGEGQAAEAEVLVGARKPVAPASALMLEEGNTGKVTVSWEAVTTDVEGNTINPEAVTYEVIDRAYNVVASGIAATSVEIDAVAEGTQAFCQFGVYAVTAGGKSDKMAATAYKPVGTPYASPWKESFSDKEVSSIFGFNYIKGQEPWKFVSTHEWGIIPQDADNGFAYLEAYGDLTALVTGKIDLEGLNNPAFTYYTFNYTGSREDWKNTLDVQVDCGDGAGFKSVKKTVVSEAGPANQWNKVVVPLSDYEGKSVIFRIVPDDLELALYTLDNLAVTSYAEYNLAVTRIQAPGCVDAGKSFEIDVTVANTGEREIRQYTVELFQGDEFLEAKEMAAIMPGATAVTTFECTASLQDAEYHAEVVCDMDNIELDNASQAVTVGVITAPVPAAGLLSAAETSEGVALSWEAPDLSAAPAEFFTETFENAQSWSSTVDGWKFIDGDQTPVGGINMLDFPCKGLQSWFVVNNTLPGIQDGTDPSRWNAPSGVQFIASEYVQRGGASVQSDDWAITPRLWTGAHALSFKAKSFDPNYLETFEVLASDGTTNTADFTAIATVVDTPNSWVEYRFKLPEGTKYAAIRSRSFDKYFLFIDDVKFIPADGEAAPIVLKGYNVYRDNVRLNSTPLESPLYTDATALKGRDYSYFVTAVYDKGESHPSNTVNILQTSLAEISGNVAVVASEGKVTVTGATSGLIEVFAADGSRVAAEKAASKVVISLAKGIYIVRAANTTAKVVVR